MVGADRSIIGVNDYPVTGVRDIDNLATELNEKLDLSMSTLNQ